MIKYGLIPSFLNASKFCHLFDDSCISFDCFWVPVIFLLLPLQLQGLHSWWVQNFGLYCVWWRDVWFDMFCELSARASCTCQSRQMKSDTPGKITDPKLPITISTHYQDQDQSDQRVSSDFIWQSSDRTRENLTRNLKKPGDLLSFEHCRS